MLDLWSKNPSECVNLSSSFFLFFYALHGLLSHIKTLTSFSFNSGPAICSLCLDPRTIPSTIHTLLSRRRRTETRLLSAQLVCTSCSAAPPATSIECVSLDCPVFYARKSAERQHEGLEGLDRFLEELSIRQENGNGGEGDGKKRDGGEKSKGKKRVNEEPEIKRKGKGRAVGGRLVHETIDLTES